MARRSPMITGANRRGRQRYCGLPGHLIVVAVLAVIMLVVNDATAEDVVIEVDSAVIAAAKKLDSDVVFFTSRQQPLTRLTEIVSANSEVGIWGLELWEGVKLLLRAAGANPVAV
jgi:hypothetical protein